MKRLLFALAVIAMVVTMAAPAGAAPDTAADFAADCNDDGELRVSGNQHYRGGTGALVGPCVITMEVGSRLVLRGLTLTGDSSLAVLGSLADTTVNVVDSRIDMAGSLELTAGCCAGDSEVPEQNGRVVVRRSTLSGSSVLLWASFDWPDGTVIVADSALHATGAQGIQVRASDVVGVDGTVSVKGSSLTSAGVLVILTGAGGTTRVSKNTSTVTGIATVTTGVGGTCRSTNNTPALPCTP